MADAGRRQRIDFAYDLTLDEMYRRTAVIEALGSHWDPVQAMAEEDEAHRLLYADLDDEQQRTFEQLVRAGVLPHRNEP